MLAASTSTSNATVIISNNNNTSNSNKHQLFSTTSQLTTTTTPTVNPQLNVNKSANNISKYNENTNTYNTTNPSGFYPWKKMISTNDTISNQQITNENSSSFSVYAGLLKTGTPPSVMATPAMSTPTYSLHNHQQHHIVDQASYAIAAANAAASNEYLYSPHDYHATYQHHPVTANGQYWFQEQQQQQQQLPQNGAFNSWNSSSGYAFNGAAINDLNAYQNYIQSIL